MFRKALDLQSQGQMSVMVTITNTKGSTPREMGAKMLVTREGFFGTIGGGELELLAIEKSREILQSESPERMAIPLCSKAHQCCGGFVELFFDVIRPQAQLYIFGAGHVAQALLECLAGTDFHCTIVDSRPEWIEAAREKAQVLKDLSLTALCEDPVVYAETRLKSAAAQTWAVVMTHDHALDEDLIAKLAPKSLRYLGLIGSRTKRERFLRRLTEKGLFKEDLNRLHCPMGIPNGGKAPKEVALSISMELICLLHSEQTVRPRSVSHSEVVL
jgi:xanthine dehydrogenase accessory factor